MMAKSSRMALAVSVCILLFLAVFAPACSQEEPPYRVALIGFEESASGEERNNMAEYGRRRVEAELGVEADLFLPGSGEDAGDVFLVGESGYDLVISLGQESSLEMLFARPEDTEAQAAALDFEVSQEVPGEDTATLVRYRVEEGAYICGYLAGWLTTRTDHPLTNVAPLAAFIGAMDDPLVVYYNIGFTRGVTAANPACGAESYFLDEAGDTQQARVNAEDAIEKGVDIFFCTPGAFNDEVIEVAEQQDALVILVGSDRSDESPEHVLTSLILRDDNAVFDAVSMALAGDLEAGRQVWGIEEGTWSLAPFHGHDPYIRKELKEALREQEMMVGTIDFSS